LFRSFPRDLGRLQSKARLSDARWEQCFDVIAANGAQGVPTAKNCCLASDVTPAIAAGAIAPAEHEAVAVFDWVQDLLTVVSQ
jgi:hypothetical protein